MSEPDDQKQEHRAFVPFRETRAINNGFWDRPAEERAARMNSACDRFGATNFFDLSPEERGWAYDDYGAEL